MTVNFLNVQSRDNGSRGVEKNQELAMNYIELAADQGFDTAQYALGNIYAKNDNSEKAYHWFEKAAAQGHEDAKKTLHECPLFEDGNVIYWFESGKMQCQYEVDSAGHVFVLLKSLNKNTSIKFSNVIASQNSNTKQIEFVVKAMMSVKEDTNLCASWINTQEVSIKIFPRLTQTSSLKGTQVYHSDKITVMIF